MQCLLYLHDFVDDCDRCVGENEWNQAHASAMMKAKVRHVKQVTGSTSSWCKKIALLLMMMPTDVEATSGVAFCHYSSTPVVMVFLIFMAIMASTAAMESSQFSSSGEDTDGWLFVPRPVNYLQYVGATVTGAIALLATWSLGSRRGYANGVEERNELHDYHYEWCSYEWWCYGWHYVGCGYFGYDRLLPLQGDVFMTSRERACG